MANAFENYMKSLNKHSKLSKKPGKYKKKVIKLRRLIREYVHENAALLDAIEEVQMQIIVRQEERKYLLKKLCQHEPHTEVEVQTFAKMGCNNPSNLSPVETKKNKKRLTNDTNSKFVERKSIKSRKNAKLRKKVVQLIPLDSTGRPVFPIELNSLTVHSLGEVLSDRSEFHSEDAIYPVGYVSTRIYGSLKDPTIKCMYTCKISDANGLPRFEIASDDNSPPIVGGTPDVCHSLLLQHINDALSLNVVSTRPRGNEFFGLTHPTILNLIQSSPGTRKCANYKWSKFEVSKNGDGFIEDVDASLNFDTLLRSINFCKYKMAPDVLQRPTEDYLDNKDNLSYLMS